MRTHHQHADMDLIHAFYKQKGFTYIGVLIAVAIIGVTASAGLQVGSILSRRDAEQELLDIGKEYRQALLSYAISTPTGQQRYPKSLDDLLVDRRYPNLKRHLRRIYPDPVTGEESWEIVMSPDGSGIIGLHSKSERCPIKIGNFDIEFRHFAGKSSYRDWVFSVPN